MSKAILIMDMPKNCDECILYYERDYCDYCGIRNEYIDINVLQSKPEWCPLKEVLQKPDYPPINESSYVAGWNACIDEILKGSEEE